MLCSEDVKQTVTFPGEPFCLFKITARELKQKTVLNALNTVSHEKRTAAFQTTSLIIDLVSKGFYYTIKI